MNKKYYTAKLTAQKRDVLTLSPRVLLTDITYQVSGELFRDHCWVPLCEKRIKPILPVKTKVVAVIQFRASEVAYKGVQGNTKTGLKDLRDVKVVRYEKY